MLVLRAKEEGEEEEGKKQRRSEEAKEEIEGSVSIDRRIDGSMDRWIKGSRIKGTRKKERRSKGEI